MTINDNKIISLIGLFIYELRIIASLYDLQNHCYLVLAFSSEDLLKNFDVQDQYFI